MTYRFQKENLRSNTQAHIPHPVFVNDPSGCKTTQITNNSFCTVRYTTEITCTELILLLFPANTDAAVYPCLVKTSPQLNSGPKTPPPWKEAMKDVTQLRMQIEDLKKVVSFNDTID